MSDREPYDRDSNDILFWLSKDSFKNDIEMEYYGYYRKLSSKLADSQSLVRHYNEMLAKYQNATNNALRNAYANYRAMLSDELANIEVYKNLLSKLESTAPIENILQRKRKPNEIITLSFLKRELPNISNSVISYQPTLYLSKEEILFIKSLDKESANHKEEKQEILKPKIKNNLLYLIPLISSFIFLFSIFDMPYGFYTFARLAVFVFSIIHLFVWHEKNKEFSAKYIPVIVIAILWNPISPIYFGKETWIVLNICAIITEGIVGVLACRSKENE